MPKLFLLFNKPYNVLSQFSDREKTSPVSHASPQHQATPDQRLTLRAFIPVPGVYPVGRLDLDSEGLMLLTNHGGVQHRLSDPRYGHSRTYWVQVERIPSPEDLQQLREGVVIRGYRTLPCEVDLRPNGWDLPPRNPPIRFRKSVPTAWITMTLKEGKNRQVRRMTAAVGHPTLRLIRVTFGPLELGHLEPGQWRHATSAERKQLLQY